MVLKKRQKVLLTDSWPPGVSIDTHLGEMEETNNAVEDRSASEEDNSQRCRAATLVNYSIPFVHSAPRSCFQENWIDEKYHLLIEFISQEHNRPLCKSRIISWSHFPSVKILSDAPVIQIFTVARAKKPFVCSFLCSIIALFLYAFFFAQ